MEKNAYQSLLRVSVGVISMAHRHTENEVAKAFNPTEGSKCDGRHASSATVSQDLLGAFKREERRVPG